MNPVVVLEEVNIYPCIICPSAFLREKELNKHVVKYNHVMINKVALEAKVVLQRIDSSIYKCDQCSACFLSARKFKLHKITHVRDSIYKNKENIPKNARFPKLFKCSDCDARFVKETTLNVHSILHTPFPFMCECGIGYRNKNDFIGHKKVVHNQNYYNDLIEPKEELEVLEEKPVLPELKPKVKSEIIYKSDPSESDEDIEPPKKRKYKAPKKEGSVYAKVLKGPPYKCEQCPQSFSASRAYMKHLNDHPPSYFCGMCTKAYISPYSLKTHIKQKHPIKLKNSTKIECEVCHKVLASKGNLIVHMRVHTGERPYPCNRCNKRFTQSVALTAHLKVHLGIKDHACRFCNKTFSAGINRIKHERTHTGEKPYKCNFCDKAFSDPSAYQRHIRTHTGVKRYKCEHCHMGFTDASGLIMHRRRMHGGEKNYHCNYCNKPFFTRADVNLHESSRHENLRLWECDVCYKNFNLRKQLQTHKNNCHNLSIYCNICMKKFFSDIALQKHKAAGCSEDKFRCDVCEQKFASKNVLKLHITTYHLSSKRCHNCRRDFHSSYHLQMHKKRGCTERKYLPKKKRKKSVKKCFPYLEE